MSEETPQLHTLAEYRGLTPIQQGYVCYMEADWPGSELKEHQSNPYPTGTKAYEQWDEGQRLGCLAAQDSEE